MKSTFKKICLLALAAVMFFALAACGSDNLTSTANKGIPAGVSDSVKSYSSVAYYEMENPQDVNIKFDVRKIQKVSFMYRVLSSQDWSLNNGVLTVKSSVFEGETEGNKRLRVFVDDMYVEITVRMVTKVIYTVDDFNGIRSNLNGVYVLGCDIDFSNQMFFPIGKSLDESESTGVFEGVFDGMGHAVKNITIESYDYGEGEDASNQGPSLDGNREGNGRNYNNGIFMSTSSNAQILNTDFINITLNTQGLGGAVVGSNGGLIKNCRVSCTLNTHGTYSERAGGIVGLNAGGDSAGKIENCIVLYSWSGEVPARGIADWNSGTIKNCFAALKDDYVFHMGYNSETGAVPEDFDYDDFVTQDNFNTFGLGWHTMPAFPGALGWVQEGGETVLKYYKGGNITNSDVVRKEYLLNPANFPESDGWDSSVWNFTFGAFPTLKVQSR